MKSIITNRARAIQVETGEIKTIFDGRDDGTSAAIQIAELHQEIIRLRRKLERFEFGSLLGEEVRG